MSLLSLAKKLGQGKSAKEPKKSALKVPAEQGEGKKSSKATSPVPFDIYPLMTEKGVRMQEQQVVVFRVPRSATKTQVAEAVQVRYGVKPLVVRMLFVRPKRRVRGRTAGQTTAWKKAYVKVKDVQSIAAGP